MLQEGEIAFDVDALVIAQVADSQLGLVQSPQGGLMEAVVETRPFAGAKYFTEERRGVGVAPRVAMDQARDGAVGEFYGRRYRVNHVGALVNAIPTRAVHFDGVGPSQVAEQVR